MQVDLFQEYKVELCTKLRFVLLVVMPWPNLTGLKDLSSLMNVSGQFVYFQIRCPRMKPSLTQPATLPKKIIFRLQSYPKSRRHSQEVFQLPSHFCRNCPLSLNHLIQGACGTFQKLGQFSRADTFLLKNFQ